MHIVALSEARTWDGRWLKYLDFLVSSLPGEPHSAKLTIERNFHTFPRAVKLALQGGGNAASSEVSSEASSSSPSVAVVVVLSSMRGQQYVHLADLARCLGAAGAPPVGLLHLQSWKPWVRH